MQHVNASDYMTGSAKQAVDTAMRDARAQVVGGTPAMPQPEGRPTPDQAAPALTPPDPARGAAA